MDPNEEPPLQRSSSSTLSAEEFESWTLLDSSPKARRLKMKPEEATKAGGQPEKEAQSDEEEEDDEEENEEVESGSEEADEEEEEEEEEVQVDKSSKPSGVEPVKNKPKQTKSENIARDQDGDGRVVEQGSSNKKRTGSNASLHSHDGSSSDGISVISESDGSEHARLLHFNKHLNFDPLQQSSVQLTPPLSPEREEDRAEAERSKRLKQLKRKRSHEDTALVPEDAVVPWRHVNRTSFVVLSIVMTGIAAILIGNSRVYENRANVDSFNHEQRLSELELENTILKNEMNKLKHLYTRSELDEQVQQAEFEWMQAMDQELQDQSPVEPEPQSEPEPPTTTAEPEPEQPQVRRVPPQDDNVRHKVVWSGDDGQPMLIADKDYVLPEFCYNKNAVKDELFSEYSTKYCDSKQRKIEAKLKKAESYASKHNKHKHPRDYKQYIHPTAEEVAEHQKQATAPPPKVPSLSPFEFDYLGAFETIKEEGIVILQSLTAILDLDPEPELIPNRNDGYLADDEASSSSSSSSSPSTSQSTISIGSVQPESGQPADAINWNDYPSWVREKYENQPEMYRKLQNKAPMLWEWERKKNQFLDEVGLTTLEEVDRRTEDELRKRRQQYEKERGGEDGHKKSEKYDDRKGKGGKYDERKEWKQDRPRNGDNRSHENKDYHQKDHTKEWKDKKEWLNGEKSREYHSNKEHRDHPQAGTSGAPSTSNEASRQKQYNGESRESSGDRSSKDHRKHGEHSKDRKDGDWKDHHKKNGDHHKHRERDSDERSSGDGSYMKQYRQEEHKKQYKSKDEYHQDKKYDERKQNHDRRRDDDHDDDDDDDDDDDHYKRRQHDKHRNGDYRKHEQKEWHDKRHKHKDEHRNKHHEEKKGHDRNRDHHQSKERRR